MSVRVVGYENGHRITVDDGPGRGRVAGYGQGNLHSLTLIGGSLVQGDPGPVEREHQMQRDAMKRLRAARR